MNRSRVVQTALIQAAVSADPAENLARTLAAAHSAADRGAQIITTQELCLSQYFCQSEDHRYFELAEPIPGPATEAFQALAKARQVVVIASLFERRAAGLYHNTAIVVDADGTLLGRYRKMHIPTTHCTTRSSTSPPATSDIASGRPATGASAC